VGFSCVAGADAAASDLLLQRTESSITMSAREELAARIERYCSLHPDANDTLDGVAWWLVQQHLQDTRAEIADAAEYLVERGILTRRQLSDGTVLFGCRSTPNRRTKS
jgi:hypothetical protein